jgi:hypothetical protein
MILTSNFKTAGHLPQAVAISLGVPRGWAGRRYTRLAPNRRLVKIMDPTTFTRLYKSEVLDKLDPMQVIRDLGGDNFVLLCWEAPGEFCHRRVVSVWMEKATGIKVEEFNPRRRGHAEWLREMQGAEA